MPFARQLRSSSPVLPYLVSILLIFSPLSLCLASSSGKFSPPHGPARLYEQEASQQFSPHQQSGFEGNGDWVAEDDDEVDVWAEWDKEKYIVKDPFDEEFDRMVEETLEHWHVPGLSVAVVHGDDTFAKGYGKAEFPSKNATPETLYYVGSTTKSFTAASILLLIEDSHRNGSALPRLDLTTPVSSIIRDEFVLPDPYATEKATLEDLLAHRTGMPRHDTSYGTDTLRGYVENLRRLPMTADLRSAWQYCNMMYTTLAYLIEKLTSTSYPEFVRTRILAPLSMANTFGSIHEARERAPQHLSVPYYWDNDTRSFVREPYLHSPVLYGAGNILSSVSDYARYLRALLARRPNFFPSPAGFVELRKAARAVQRLDEDYAPWSSPPLYGLAWTRQTYRGLEVFSHDGSVTGYGALMAYAPRAGWAVAVMANTEVRGNYAADRVFWRLLEGVAGTPPPERWDSVGHWEREREAMEGRRRDARAILWPEAPPGGDELPPALPVERYAGVYRNGGYGELRFEVADGHWASPYASSAAGDGLSGGGAEGRDGSGSRGGAKHLHASVTDKVWQFELCLEHVSGEFFLAWMDHTPDWPHAMFELEMPQRAVFQVGVSGKVERFLIAAEPKMGNDMIVFERVSE